VIGGNAHFTVSNGLTYFRYQIKTSGRESLADSQGSLLVYTWHNGRRLYVGRLNEYTGVVHIGRRSRFDNNAMAFKVILWACNVLWTGRNFPPGYHAETVGRCGHCGRKLADVNQYFGPECRRISINRLSARLQEYNLAYGRC